MKNTLLLLISLVFASAAGAQGQNSWTKKATFAAGKRERAVAFAIGDYGYVATGEDTVNITHNDLWRYDPELDSWTQMADLPGPARRNAVGFTLNNKGYVGTGIDSSESANGTKLKDFWEYDPDSNSWTQRADYPGAGGNGVYYAGCFTADNKGYVTCGKYGPSTYAFDLWEYKPTTDTWTQRANFPGGVRYAVSALAIDGKGYVGMGIDEDIYRKDWWQYDPSTNVWEQREDLPGTERGAASTFTIGSKGFVVFGGDGGYKDELWEYNPYQDSWNIKSNFSGGERRNGIAFTVNNRGYAGIGKGPSGMRRNFYEYTPLYPLSTGVEEILDIQTYPNPATDHVQIWLRNESDAKTLLIYDQSGNEISQTTISGQTIDFERNNLPAGTYFLVLTGSKSQVLGTAKILFI